MGAFRVLLTHFSQRYPKIPVFASTYNHTTAIAFDLMTVNLSDLVHLPKMLPVLQYLFKDEHDEMLDV